jgi:uncharacterized membrane protein YraQ (UPF0718 family)
MLAAPSINPVVIASTWAAFSGDRTGLDGLTSYQMVTLRVGLAFITAFVVGMVVSAMERKHGVAALIKPVQGGRRHEHAHDHGHKHDHGHAHHHVHAHTHTHREEHSHGPDCPECPGDNGGKSLPVVESAVTPAAKKVSWRQRLINISETSLHDFIDITCFLILGAFLASLVRVFNVLDYAPNLSNAFVAVPVMMGLAVLLCLCSEADAFVAANLVQVSAAQASSAIQIPLAGKLAFLVLGPMLDLKLYFMYTRVFRTRLIWTIIPCVVVLVFSLTLLTGFLDWAAR